MTLNTGCLTVCLCGCEVYKAQRLRTYDLMALYKFDCYYYYYYYIIIMRVKTKQNVKQRLQRFLLRDADMHTAYLLRQRGWLGATRRYSIKRAKPILKLLTHAPITNSKGNSFKYTRGGKSWWFSTEISVYFGNGARLADGYYGTLIGSHGCRIEWYNFRWHYCYYYYY